MQKNFILILIGSILIILFALSNATSVAIRFFFWKFEISLALIIFLSAAVGAILAVLFGGIKQLARSKEIKRITAENQRLTSELDLLKAQNENKIVADDSLPKE